MSKQPAIVFDAGPIINLTLNNLLWVLPRLKASSGARFLLPYGVKKELIDKPLTTKKYKLEAFQILPYIRDGTLELVETDELKPIADELDEILNDMLYAFNKPVQLVHFGELTALACCIKYEAMAMVIDERTTRYIVETPSKLKRRMEKRLHTKVKLNKSQVDLAKEKLKGIRCLRSVELAAASFHNGLFDSLALEGKHTAIQNPKKEILSALLWALKLHGCAISEQEIKEMQKIVHSLSTS